MIENQILIINANGLKNEVDYEVISKTVMSKNTNKYIFDFERLERTIDKSATTMFDLGKSSTGWYIYNTLTKEVVDSGIENRSQAIIKGALAQRKFYLEEFDKYYIEKDVLNSEHLYSFKNHDIDIITAKMVDLGVLKILNGEYKSMYFLFDMEDDEKVTRLKIFAYQILKFNREDEEFKKISEDSIEMTCLQTILEKEVFDCVVKILYRIS